MENWKIGNELQSISNTRLYGGAVVNHAAMQANKLSQAELEEWEQLAQKRHELLMRQQRAVMVINLAQQVYLCGVKSGAPYSIEGAIGTAEKFIAAAEEYLRKAGEE